MGGGGKDVKGGGFHYAFKSTLKLKGTPPSLSKHPMRKKENKRGGEDAKGLVSPFLVGKKGRKKKKRECARPNGRKKKRWSGTAGQTPKKEEGKGAAINIFKRPGA